MSAEVQHPLQPINWQKLPRDPEYPPGLVLLEWLADDGLLTAKLRRACREGFRLELLDAGAGPGLMIAERKIRRVVLWCGDNACVYAESHIPQEALNLLPRLQSLGADPLGEALRAHPDVRRSSFDYALFHTPRLPVGVRGHDDGPLWARRSSFNIGESSLAVAELFLPGIESLGP